MSSCSRCGAPLQLAADRPVSCEFCGTENQPAPKEVPVVVPVQVVHNTVQVVGGAASPAELEVRCPHCGKRLVMVRAAEVDLHGCGGCGGIWIDNDSARKVLAKPERVFVELATRAAANARGGASRAPRATCPRCPAVLDRVDAHGIELDVCGDHGTWFDARELALLVATLRGEHVPVARHAKADEIECSGCHMVIKRSQANLTEDGLQCERCWRKPDLAYAKAIAQQARDETAGKALLGLAVVMLGAAAAAGSSKS